LRRRITKVDRFVCFRKDLHLKHTVPHSAHTIQGPVTSLLLSIPIASGRCGAFSPIMLGASQKSDVRYVAPTQRRRRRRRTCRTALPDHPSRRTRGASPEHRATRSGPKRSGSNRSDPPNRAVALGTGTALRLAGRLRLETSRSRLPTDCRRLGWDLLVPAGSGWLLVRSARFDSCSAPAPADVAAPARRPGCRPAGSVFSSAAAVRGGAARRAEDLLLPEIGH